MLNVMTVTLLAALLTLLSSIVLILTIYLHKRVKRNNPWESSSSVVQPVTTSAPISRRTSTAYLINLEKPIQTSRSRSASFSEDLRARLQILAAGNTYRSHPSTITATPSLRSTRSSLSANTRFSSPSTNSFLAFELRYENTIETLHINICQLQNYVPMKNSQMIFLILYLRPNDDEQRQTRSSNTGVFNEQFQFLIKPTELSNRTLRITAYTVDSTTRIRQTLGHVFVKLDQFLAENQTAKILSECLIQDPQIRSDYLGELILTNTYFKEQNLLRIHLQQINQFHINPSRTSFESYFSGQTSNTSQKNHWINTSVFSIPSTSTSFRVDQELNLPARSLISSTHNDHLDCHLRLHIHGINEVHSHARWQPSLRSNSTQTITVPLVAF